MNTQEVIEKINNIDTLNINDMIAGQQVDMVIKNQVLDIINQIHEPEKPVIPRFVADWIKYSKTTFCSLKRTISFDETYTANYANWSRDKVKLISWMSNRENQDIFARAWLFGYEVEKEKLYTVEIPDPHGLCKYRYLCKNSNGVTFGTNVTDIWKSSSDCKLTESEIKEDFEWAWQWAKPVEGN